MSPSTSSLVDDIVLQFALWAYTTAEDAMSTLLNAFGSSTEPDFASIVGVYDRMLAIALLLLGGVIAFGITERILGGPAGIGWSAIPRTVAAIAFACSGLGVVEYVAHYAALLATTWTPDLLGVHNQLATLRPQVQMPANGGYPLGSLGGLILTALLTSFMALLVYLELILRGALILIVSAFIPLVCVLSVWPRLAGAAAGLGEFLVGLLLSKFVVATAIYIGYGLVLPAVLSGQHSDWMVTGLAVLFIAAFSPLALVQGLRFTSSAAGQLSREWIATGAGLVAPTVLGLGRSVAAPRLGRLLSAGRSSRSKGRTGTS